MYIVFIHIVSLFFAYFNGRHDAPAVNSFAYSGSTPQQQSIFHGSNWKLKILVCSLALLPLSLGFSWELLFMCGIGFVVAGLNIWATFDIWVNKFRSLKVDWWYLSDGNNTDRILLKIFGKKAGIYKLVLCVLVSAILTVVYFKIQHNGS